MFNKKYLFFVGYFLAIFYCVIFISCFFIYKKSLIVFLVFSLVFFPLFFFAKKSQNFTFHIFLLFLFLSEVIGSFYFFEYEDRYTISGFSAVGKFNFFVIDYFKIFFIPFIFLYIVSFLIILIDFLLPPLKVSLITNNEVTKIKVKRGSRFYTFLCFLFLVLLSYMNYLMFINQLGITGINPPRLPYKLTGISYLFSRFIAPFILFYLLLKSRRNLFLYFVIFIYSAYAATTQVSRTTLTTFFLPLVYFLVKDKSHKTLFVFACLFLLYLPLIEYARNFVYLVDNGVVGVNSLFSIKDIFEGLIDSDVEFSIQDSLYTIIARLGGTQDVVLASYYDNMQFGGSFKEFLRIFLLFDFGNLNQIQASLYGFYPPEGFSPGDGAFLASSYMIIGNNFVSLISLSFFIAILISLNNRILINVSFHIKSKLYYYVNSFFFCVILIPRLNNLWLFYFLGFNVIFFLILKIRSLIIV